MRTPHRSPGSHRAQLIFLAGAVTGTLVVTVLDRATWSEADRGLELVRTVRDLVTDSYVAEVPPSRLVDDALRGMVDGLDRYSHYYGPEEIAALDRETSGEFRGIGVVFRRDADVPGQVLFPFPGSPAARGGLQVGDTIETIEGRVVAELDPGELQRTFGTATEALQLSVRDLDGVERPLEVLPERIVDPSVRHVRMLDEEHGIGYVALLSFSHRSPDEFDAAVESLEERGLRALVLDLRANPGGILEAAQRIANRFVDHGVLVTTRTRQGDQVAEADPEQARWCGMPLVALVDGGSASSSEVLAGALRDHRAAVLVGEPTYGKGTVQTLTSFDGDRAVVKLTTAIYLTPSGTRIERNGDGRGEHGLFPDVEIDLEEGEQNAIHRYLASYSPPEAVLPDLTAWEERAGVSLIPRPPEDRQLAAAIELLEGRFDRVASRGH